ncbi:hypothetical protein A2707_00740 [Candidatus Saccharibacteria bacterium RIFCSPHIGHO2_01_FULL_45_15]|nr:MAG: hypothetical protein A2707_00740 [Candidatus Saccharibacteria bacterium RIFCSPHIGHO2_01_FULL_45_15]
MSDNINERIKARMAAESAVKEDALIASYHDDRAKLAKLTVHAHVELQRTDYPRIGPYSSSLSFQFITEYKKEDTAAWRLSVDDDEGYTGTSAFMTADGRLVYFRLDHVGGSIHTGNAMYKPRFMSYLNYLTAPFPLGPSNDMSRARDARDTVSRLQNFIERLQRM